MQRSPNAASEGIRTSDHILVLDGVYITQTSMRQHFVPVSAPVVTDFQTLIERISERVGRHMKRRGLLLRDA